MKHVLLYKIANAGKTSHILIGTQITWWMDIKLKFISETKPWA